MDSPDTRRDAVPIALPRHSRPARRTRRGGVDPVARLARIDTLSGGSARLLAHAGALRAWQAVRLPRSRQRVPAELVFAIRLLAGDDGATPFTLRHLAECARVNERSVRLALRRLGDMGWVEAADRPSGDRRERPYRCTPRLARLLTEVDALLCVLNGPDALRPR